MKQPIRMVMTQIINFFLSFKIIYKWFKVGFDDIFIVWVH